MKRAAGMTLLETMLAVTLLSVLSVAMMLSMRLGVAALQRTDQRLMDNRRVAGAQRIVEQELEGLIPVTAPCLGAGGEGGPKVPMFSGQPGSLMLISTFSLQRAWRGRPQVLQFFTRPSENGGMSLVVNEIPYAGPKFVGAICTGIQHSQEAPGNFGQFTAPSASPTTFVLADRLRTVGFQYLRRPEKEKGEEAGVWLSAWQRPDWPAGIRIVMEPLETSAARLQPVTITAPVYIYRTPGADYVDR